MEQKIKTSWGGRREGAGRSKKDIGKHYSFGATKDVTEILESFVGNRTEFINNAIRVYHSQLKNQ